MRHFLLSASTPTLAIPTLPIGVAATSFAALLVPAAGPVERLSTRFRATVALAVDLPAITAAADHHLLVAARAVEQPMMRLDGRSWPSSKLDLTSPTPPYSDSQVTCARRPRDLRGPVDPQDRARVPAPWPDHRSHQQQTH